jgi:ketosteroid isomerase-like protein
MDSVQELAVFGGARDAFLATVREIPSEALQYLRPGDDYSLGGLTVHVNFVLEHYLNVLEALESGGFGECRPEDPPDLEARANERARSRLSADEVEAELARTGRLHQEVEALVGRLGTTERRAAVWYPGSAAPYPTSVSDVLGWLTGHYREHMPHIGALLEAWRVEAETRATLAVVERFNEAFGRGDVDAVMDCMTEDCVFENTYPPPDGERHVGQSDVRGFWERFFGSTVQPRFETEEMVAAGDRVLARWCFSWGEPESEGHVRGVDVFRVRDGKVAEKLAYVKG